MLRSISRFALMVCTSVVFAACAGTIDKITHIGQPPPLSPIAVPPNIAAGGPVFVAQPAPPPNRASSTRCGVRAPAASSVIPARRKPATSSHRKHDPGGGRCADSAIPGVSP